METEARILHDISEKEEEQLKSAYSDVAQLVPKSKPNKGYVQIELLKKRCMKKRLSHKLKPLFKTF